jgi:iron complex outermembrane receptor protein
MHSTVAFVSKLKASTAILVFSGLVLSGGAAFAQDTPPPDQQPAAKAPQTRLDTVVSQATRVETSVQTTPVAVTAFDTAQIARTFATDLRDLTGPAPNVQLEPVGAFQNASAFAIRGFAGGDIESASDPNVAIMIDGVYQARTSTALSDLLDISHVEILRGPQGTLFGRNAIVGAVIVNHTAPEMNEFSVYGAVKAGNYGTIDISGIINVPLVDDRAALRLAVKSSNNDGFYDNLTDGTNYGGTDRITILPSIRFTPNDNLDIVIRGEVVRERDDSWANVPFSTCGGAGGVFNPFDPVTQVAPLVSWAAQGQEGIDKICGDEVSDDNRPFDIYADNSAGRGSNFDVWGITGEVNYTIPDVGTITYVGNYRHVDEDVFNDFDTTDLPIFMTRRQQEHYQTTHELRFASDFSDKIDLVAGLYYFDQKYKMDQGTFGWLFDPNFGTALGAAIVNRLFGVPNAGAPLFALNALSEGFGRTTQTDSSWAAFANINWNFWGGLTLVAGVRYTDEKKDFETCAPAPVNTPFQDTEIGCNLDPTAIGYNYFNSDTDLAPDSRKSWNNISPKAGLNWQATDDLFLYASWTRGFRSGGFNGRCGSTATCQPFNPEKNDSYEIGVKWNGLDDRLRVNLTGFWMKYTNQQIAIIRSSAGSGGGQETITANAGASESKGIELEINAVPADGLTTWASLGYLNAKTTKLCTDTTGGTFFDDPAELAAAIAASCDQSPEALFQLPNGAWIIPRDLSGRALGRAPEWSLAAGFAYEIPVGDAGSLTLAADWRYQSKSVLGTIYPNASIGSTDGVLNYNGYLVNPWRKANNIFNASLTWKEAQDRYQISIFGKNLTNERYIQALTAVATLFNFTQWNNPRTWGVEASFKF